AGNHHPMPTIFIVALIAFAALVALIVILAVVFGGFRPSRRSSTDFPSSSGGSDYTGLGG
ncbi:MAG TPA: hypothetical protein VGM91_07695, partial [Conexibacter sp.]